MFGLKITNASHFHPLEVVGRGSETQLQATYSDIFKQRNFFTIMTIYCCLYETVMLSGFTTFEMRIGQFQQKFISTVDSITD